MVRIKPDLFLNVPKMMDEDMSLPCDLITTPSYPTSALPTMATTTRSRSSSPGTVDFDSDSEFEDNDISLQDKVPWTEDQDIALLYVAREFSSLKSDLLPAPR
jgi:hypothetical protein